MKEFDKIYVAKYEEMLTLRQLADDLNTTIKKVADISEELKLNGIKDIYKNIPDNEWEKLEKLQDEQIKTRYYKESKYMQDKVKQEIFKIYKIENISKCIKKFPIYSETKEDFNRNYIENNYEDEKWKRIGTSNYEVSNYGRIKNIQTNKLKKLKYQVYGMQVVLWDKSKGQTITVSRIVAEMFIRHLEKNERVIHIDGNKRNNFVKNLKIVSM